MQLKKVTIFLIIALSLASSVVSAQDVEYTQFYANPNYLNPALAGNKIVPRITINYRNQWPSIKKGYVSYSVCGDMFVEKINGGLALQVTADQMETMEAYNISLAYSYQVRLTNKLTSNLAIQAGYFQYGLNWYKLIFQDAIEYQRPTEEVPPDNLTTRNPDFTAGITFGYNERLYGGLVLSHLNRPDMAFYSSNIDRLPMKYTIHAGALISLKQGVEGGGERKQFSISPNLVYFQQGEFHQLNAGISANLYPLFFGLWHRNNFGNPDALIALLGIEFKDFKFGLSYDLTVSRLTSNTGGATEISIGWLLQPLKKEIRYRAIKSPTF